MSIMRLYFGSDESPPVDTGALDLGSCVYDGTTTRVWSSTPSGGNSCEFNNSDGLEAWCQAGSSSEIFQGVDFTTPYEAPGGDISSNGNSLTATIQGAKFSQDGTLLFTTGTTAIRLLSTPYLMSSQSITSVNPALDGAARTISWNGMHVYAATSTSLQKWDLLSDWDIVGAATAGPALDLPNNATGICVSRDESRIYLITSTASPIPKVVQEYIMGTPGDLSTIPTDGFGVAIPNFSLEVTSYMNGASSLAVSYNQEHLMIGGASAGGGTDGAYIVTFTGTAV